MSDVARAGAKVRDYWFTVMFTDPLAIPITASLVPRRAIKPSYFSIIAFITGLTAGVLFATGTRSGLIAGALAFYGAFVADCIDGKLARARGDVTKRGAALDKLADGGRRAGASLGLTIWLWRAEGVPETDVLWGVAYTVMAYYFLELSGAEAPLEKTTGSPGTRATQDPSRLFDRWTSALQRRRLLPTPGMPDIQALVFIVGPLTGFVVPALALGIVLAATGAAINLRRRMK